MQVEQQCTFTKNFTMYSSKPLLFSEFVPSRYAKQTHRLQIINCKMRRKANSKM